MDIGLVLFVYTIGLANGPGFFSKFQREGMREVLFIVGIMILPAILLLIVHIAFRLTPATTAGIFTGMSNNTPALASVLDLISSSAADPEKAASEAVVGFSVVYPLGVFARMLVLAFILRIWQVDFAGEAYRLRKQYPIAKICVTVRLMSPRPVSSTSLCVNYRRSMSGMCFWPPLSGRRHQPHQQ
ncbi:MAG: hypothetical protein M5U34_38530 [Chloroflexi bacterium]|nr:hypothetical protein [Chloroflexota bacterium]